jgi:hypothetical protein
MSGMTKLFDLPESLLVSFLFVWSDLRSLGMFDSAMSSKTDRMVYFQAIKFERQPIEQFVTIQNKESSELFHKWLLKRCVTLNNIKFMTTFFNSENLIVRKWLASGIYELNTLPKILKLALEKFDICRRWSGSPQTHIGGGYIQFPELQLSVCNLINQCSSLKSLEFWNCGICDVTLMNSLNLSGLNINELIIIDEKAVKYGKILLVTSLMKFNSLSILTLQFTCPLTHLDQVEVVALMKLNPNLTHLDLEKIRLVDDTFLSSLRTECKALEWLRCISECGPAGRYPTASSISEYLKAPHQNMKHFKLVSGDYYDKTNGIHTCNPSSGDFTFDFDQLGDITAVVRMCSKLAIKSVFTGLTKLRSLDDARRVCSGETLAEYLLIIMQ